MNILDCCNKTSKKKKFIETKDISFNRNNHVLYWYETLCKHD